MLVETKSNSCISSKGKRSEAVVVRWLVSKGFSIINRNFRCRFGEIDIIAERKRELYFIEVRSKFLRANIKRPEMVLAAEQLFQSVNSYKKSKIISSGYYFLNSASGRRFANWDLNLLMITPVWCGDKKVFIKCFVE